MYFWYDGRREPFLSYGYNMAIGIRMLIELNQDTILIDTSTDITLLNRNGETPTEWTYNVWDLAI